MKNESPFNIAFQALKVLLIKIYKIQPPTLLFLILLFYISFYNFLELHSTLLVLTC